MANPTRSDPIITISESVIEEALESVERAESKSPDSESQPAPEPKPSPGHTEDSPPHTEDPIAEVECSLKHARPEGIAQTLDIDSMRADLLRARQALRICEAKQEVAEERLAEQREHTLRALAELENMKNRVARERADLLKYGQERLLKDLLVVADNFDRAIASATTPADFASLRAGLVLTKKLLEDVLGRSGVRSFSALNTQFDPHFHEAIHTVESETTASGTVVQEVTRGYMFYDRLMRPAAVVVSSNRKKD